MNSKELHAFCYNNKNFLYSAKCKQAYMISDCDFELLNNYKVSINDKHLVINKYIVNKSEDELVINDINDFTIYLNIANTCNAECVYCFAHQGNYGKEDSLMDCNTMIQSIDYFFNNLKPDSRISIVFFGGEPLLSFPVLRDCCNYIKIKYPDRIYKFSITSNGTLLTKQIIDFFEENNIKLALSIDGGERIHNNQRPLKNKKNSFLESTKHLNYILSKKIDLLVRGTYCNFDESLSECYKDLIELGFKEINIIPDYIHIKNREQLNLLLKQLDMLYNYIINYIKYNDDFPFTQFSARIRQLFYPKIKRKYNCSLGEKIFCVDTIGDIYPCHRFSDNNEYILGNVKEHNNFKLNKKFEKLESIMCDKCWNRYTCNYGCVYEDLQSGNVNIKNQKSCLYQKKMTELCISLCNNMSVELLRRILKV